MSSSAEFRKDHAALKRIVATLFALAALSGRVSDFPRPVRFLVLWIMRPAEAVIREFVLDLAWDAGFPAEMSERLLFEDHDSRDAALRLAWRFHVLGELLQDVLGSSDFYSGDASPPATRRLDLRIERLGATLNAVFRQLQVLPRWAMPAPDT